MERLNAYKNQGSKHEIATMGQVIMEQRKQAVTRKIKAKEGRN